MKTFFSKLANFRFLRVVFAIMLSVYLVFSNAIPAFAIGSDRSNPKEGEARLDEIYQKSKDILKSPPPSMEKVQAETEKGVNEVQGAADIEEMHRPDNSQQATSAAEQVEKALDNVIHRR